MDHQFHLIEVTPELAAEWLAKNIDINRSVRDAKVAQFARDMKASKWRLTHQAIAFDWNDRLIDGQHRLKAIIKHGSSVPLWVYRNLDPTSFAVIDSGSARNASDVLKKHGLKNSAVLAAGIRLAIKHSKRIRTSKLHSKTYTLSHSEIEQYALDNWDHCVQAAAFAASVRRECPSIRAAAAAGFCLLSFNQFGEQLFEEAQIFLGRVAVGADLTHGSAELALRKFIEANSPRTHNINSTDYSLGIYIKAFNYYLREEPVITFKPGTLIPFPTLAPKFAQ